MLIKSRLFGATVAVALVTGTVGAPRPRTTTQDTDSAEVATNMPAPPLAPATVSAKYEGGVFGYNKKLEGTLNFDVRQSAGTLALFWRRDERLSATVGRLTLTFEDVFNDLVRVSPVARGRQSGLYEKHPFDRRCGCASAVRRGTRS